MKRSLYGVYCLLMLAATGATSAKILIFTYAFNRPDFIELQYKTFKKFFEDEYDFVVFSDATTQEMHQKIADMCNKYSVTCVRIPQEIHKKPYLNRGKPGSIFSDYQAAAVRNCNVVQYSLDTVGFQHDDIVVLVDSDMFPVKKFNIRDFMRGYDVAAELVQCGRRYPNHDCKKTHPRLAPFEYLWIGLVFLDMRTMPNKRNINFNCGTVFNKVAVDAGGYTAYYLKDNPQARVKGFLRKTLEDLICPSCANKKKPAPPCTHNAKMLQDFGLEHEVIKFSQQMPLVGNYISQYGRPCEYLMDGTFLHYRGGTNHHKASAEYHHKKTLLFNSLFDVLLSVN